MKDAALKTACDRILEKVSDALKPRGSDSHRAYLKLWKTLRREDKQIELMFDDLKRSTAIFKLAMWYKNGILSDNELKDFTEVTQNKVKSICNI